MTAELIKGQPLVKEMTRNLSRQLKALAVPPRVAAVHNTDDAGVGYYMRSQKRLCEKHGIPFDLHPIDSRTPPTEVLALVDRLNADPSVTGITVHIPTPEGHDAESIVTRVAPEKDIEAIHPYTLGRLARGDLELAPCAAAAALALARCVVPSMRGLEVTVVGRSAIVGLPVVLLLLRAGKEAPTPTVCHTGTADLARHTKRADILFSAAGRAGLIRGDMLKPGAVVIDIGANPTDDGGIVGDVVFSEAVEVAAHITPVPGGVGPVTLAILLKNIVTCAQKTASRAP